MHTQTDAPIEKEDMEEESNPAFAKFQSADLNKDGSLDESEFVAFSNPFRHEHMIHHLVNDQLMMYDDNKDNLISIEEFVSKSVSMVMVEGGQCAGIETS